MMKKLLLLCIPFFLYINTYSQEHQVSAGMGLGTTVQMLDVLTEIGGAFSSIFFKGSYLDKTDNIGEFRISYAYTPKDRWSYGATLSYNQSKFDALIKGEKIGEQVNDYYTLAAETSFAYFKKERMSFYALLGAGATLGNVKQTRFSTGKESQSNGTIFNFQITPVGFRYGKQWGGFAEMGFGYRGLLNFGAFYTL